MQINFDYIFLLHCRQKFPQAGQILITVPDPKSDKGNIKADVWDSTLLFQHLPDAFASDSLHHRSASVALLNESPQKHYHVSNISALQGR